MPVEDWEQFFSEKSERRAEKSRLDERRQRLEIAIGVGLIAALVLGGIVLAAAF